MIFWRDKARRAKVASQTPNWTRVHDTICFVRSLFKQFGLSIVGLQEPSIEVDMSLKFVEHKLCRSI